MKFIFQYSGKLTENFTKQALDIYNEENELLYKVRSGNLMFGAKSRITNTHDEEVALIKQKLSLVYTYDILKSSKKVANITKKVLTFKPQYKIKGIDWKIEGKLFSREYNIVTKAGDIVAKITRESMFQEAAYSCDIVDATADPVLVVALVSAFDIVLMTKK